MADHSLMKLGKGPVKRDERTLSLRHYFPKLPTPPTEYDCATGVLDWPMYLNDQIGDCTCAAAGHMIEVWTAIVEGHPTAVPNSEILSAYEALSGYDPSTGANDNGAVELDVLNAWRKGQIFSDYPLEAFVSVDTNRVDLVKIGTWLFAGAYIGIALPITAQSQEVWDVVPDAGPDGEPGSWGGHAVPVFGYNDKGVILCTWGQLKSATWAFWHAYVDEAYVAIPVEYDKLGTKPAANGFSEAQLLKDLAAFPKG